MSKTIGKMLLTAAAVVLPALGCRAAGAGVTVLQNGVAPKADYAGCTDTWIGNGPWGETRRNHAHRPTLVSAPTGKKTVRNILMRFDLSPIAKGEKIRRAVLRLSDAGYPRRDKDGALRSRLRAYRMTREWKDNANWSEHTRVDPRKEDEGDWKTPGGEYDQATDFGHGADGVVGTGTMTVVGGVHVHELDVTPIVRQWHAGELPNHGFLITGGATVAGSEWGVPAQRPRLIVDHGGKPAGIEALPDPPGKDLQLDPAAKTPDAGKAADDHAVVRVGRNADCALRGDSTDTYVKTNTKLYPGAWGFMTHCRVGGTGGDVSRTLMYFDLSEIHKSASIKSAKLVCSLVGRSTQVTAYRNGAFLLKLPESPGFSTDATADERLPGKPWPGGDVVACSGPHPVAIGQCVREEYKDHRGRKRTRWGKIAFDLTGAVRAWVSGKVPNCGVVLDNRIEGGTYDIYGCRAWDPDKRPYLEIEVSPAVKARPKPVQVDKSVLTGDYWVDAMRQVHKDFKGKKGTLAQYGDSITIANPFLGGHSYKLEPKNASPEVQKECGVVREYADISLWRKWKGKGNTGCTTSDWMFRGVDGWQKDLNPEAAVIMFGTNDGMSAPQYAENTASSLKRIMRWGTVPVLTTPPPKAGHHKEHYRLACMAISKGLKVPLIDFYAEILRRRPDDWNGQLPKFKEYKGYQQPTLMHDAHPTYPKPWRGDWSEKALSNNGYELRNYMTVRMYYQVITKVFQAAGE